MYVLKLSVIFIPFYVYCIEPGPKYVPTKGEVWPEPRIQDKKKTYYVLIGNGTFRIRKPYYSCYILDEAIKRFNRNVANRLNFLRRKINPGNYYYNRHYRGNYCSKTLFSIELTKQCEKYPHLDMDEKYKLTVGDQIVLSSASIWGILRGLETFNHLLYYSDDYMEIRINSTIITDYPAYSHRGLLIDTGRHYLLPQTIETIIDAMEMNKMNVLHWHIVDDESFPFQSEQLPLMSKSGAFHPTMVYSKEVIRRIIERARLAGIRVVPEFDAPGHVRSWGAAYLNILTDCYDENDKFVEYGSLDPIYNDTHRILKVLYQEVVELFPDEYIHLGGDEVNTQCWLSNLEIHKFRKQQSINSASLPQVLLTGFLNAVTTMLPPKSTYILWQEMFDEGVTVPSKTLIQVWKKDDSTSKMIEILNSGKRVLFSSSWYLDVVNATWETFYGADPRHMVYNQSRSYGNMSAHSLRDIVGGEACMWGEMVDDTNILSRLWPRASAVAERLWTGTDMHSSAPIAATVRTRRRMEEHACRMRHRDVPAEPPNGAGYCIGPL